jgi:hypothetical protein
MAEPASSTNDPSPVGYEPGDGWWLLAVVMSIAFVALAVVLEVLGGSFANSPVPDWAHVVPIAWPSGLRVLWWTAVAAAAGLFRLGLHRLSLRQRPIVVAASVLPFLAFAAGIAAGADWATWH